MLALVVDALTNLIKQKKNKDNASTEEEKSEDGVSFAKRNKEFSQLFVLQLSSLVALGRYPLNKSLQEFVSASLR